MPCLTRKRINPPAGGMTTRLLGTPGIVRPSRTQSQTASSLLTCPPRSSAAVSGLHMQHGRSGCMCSIKGLGRGACSRAEQREHEAQRQACINGRSCMKVLTEVRYQSQPPKTLSREAFTTTKKAGMGHM
eukprot:1158687-Pelagomonas_calceolata.AAC.5